MNANPFLDRHCDPKVTRLEPAAARALLQYTPDWTIEDGTLVRTFRFADFRATMAFVNRVADLAEREDHHPDLIVSYGRCRVAWNTHSVEGLSENDFICAAKIDAGLGT